MIRSLALRSRVSSPFLQTRNAKSNSIHHHYKYLFPQPKQNVRKQSNKSNTSNTSESTSSYNNPSLDPHQVSDTMIRSAQTEIRTSGTEAINTQITPETHVKNYVMALSLVGFVTGVWYYSIQSVGQSGSSSGDNNGMVEELIKDAEMARKEKKMREGRERSVEELAQLDITGSEYDNSSEEDDELIVAVAADDDTATREEDLNMKKMKSGSGGKPLWKKVVFFWKRD
jgi:hypothetical protein